MTTTIKVITNGNYVAEVRRNGVDAGHVGPGTMVEKVFHFDHGQANVYEITERQATPEEVAASASTPEAIAALPTAG